MTKRRSADQRRDASPEPQRITFCTYTAPALSTTAQGLEYLGGEFAELLFALHHAAEAGAPLVPGVLFDLAQMAEALPLLIADGRPIEPEYESWGAVEPLAQMLEGLRKKLHDNAVGYVCANGLKSDVMGSTILRLAQLVERAARLQGEEYAEKWEREQEQRAEGMKLYRERLKNAEELRGVDPTFKSEEAA